LIGRSNLLETSIDLAPANWLPIQTNICTNVVMTFTDVAPAPARRFYRVVELP